MKYKKLTKCEKCTGINKFLLKIQYYFSVNKGFYSK